MDWQPLFDAAERLTGKAGEQRDAVRELFTALDELRNDLEVRFHELSRWNEQLHEREAALSQREGKLNQLLDECVGLVQQDGTQESSDSISST